MSFSVRVNQHLRLRRASRLADIFLALLAALVLHAPTGLAGDVDTIVDIPPVDVIEPPVIRLGEEGQFLPHLWLAMSVLPPEEKDALKGKMAQLGRQIDRFNRRGQDLAATASALALRSEEEKSRLRVEAEKLSRDLQQYEKECGVGSPQKGSRHCADAALELNKRRRALINETTRLREEILESNRTTRDLIDEVSKFAAESLRPLLQSIFDKSSVAKVGAASGDVRDIDLTGRSRPLALGATVGGQRTIETGSAGAVKLLVAGDVTVIGGPNARFTFEARLNPTGRFSFDLQEAIYITRGKFRYISAVVKKMMNRRFRIRTPNGAGAPRGTDMIVDVDDDGRTTITMLEGQLEVTPAGSETSTLVDARQSATIEPDGRVQLVRDIDTREVVRQWNSLPGVRDLPPGEGTAASGHSNWGLAWRAVLVLIPLVLLAYLLRRRQRTV